MKKIVLILSILFLSCIMAFAFPSPPPHGNGANCPAGSYPLGVDMMGAVEDCTVAGPATSMANDTLWNAVGDIVYATGNDAGTVLSAGAEGTLLMGNGAAAPSFLAAGTAGYFLIAAGAADPVWTAQATLASLEGLTFTNGDIIYASAADTLAVLDSGAEGTLLMGNGAAAPSFLAAGTAGYFLIAAGAADPVWTVQATLASLEALSLTNGNIIYASAADTLAVLAPGTAGYKLTANGAAAPTWNAPREFSALPFTNGETQTAVTEAHMIANKYITDQGSAAETDLILTAVSYHIAITVLNEEATIVEICPPSGEILYLDGTALDANDCVDSPGASGSSINVERRQDAAEAYHYYLSAIDGVWVDADGED